MNKATFVIGFGFAGFLLIAIALLGMLDILDAFLFVHLDILRESWEWSFGVIGLGLLLLVFAGLLNRVE